ncbi:MAG: type II toxin-antitoxin system Phd/YefM family antitoxin [Chloroflexi bacterium]|nr:type II toxin-antitoxin system Phd/YefM family antitoxin [Chloroflexota bacterium]
MKQVGIRELKDNPSAALRAARHEPVLITNRDDPEAVILSIAQLDEHAADVRLGLATVLFDERAISLGRAARLAGRSIESFMEHLGSRGVPVFRSSREELAADLVALGE